MASKNDWSDSSITLSGSGTNTSCTKLFSRDDFFRRGLSFRLTAVREGFFSSDFGDCGVIKSFSRPGSVCTLKLRELIYSESGIFISIFGTTIDYRLSLRLWFYVVDWLLVWSSIWSFSSESSSSELLEALLTLSVLLSEVEFDITWFILVRYFSIIFSAFSSFSFY